MARIWSSGFELQSVATGVEWDNAYGTGSPTIDTSLKRSGNASLNVTNPSTGMYRTQFYSGSSGIAVTYFRIYIYITTAPSAETDLFGTITTNPVAIWFITLSSDKKLRFYHIYTGGGSDQIGGASDALSLETWYRIEVKWDATNESSINAEALIDGSSFASEDGISDNFESLGYEPRSIYVGMSVATANVNYDDVAINDSSGSYQNSYPGEGSVVHLKPNAAGDNNPTTGTYESIDEVTPNDATDYIQLDTNGTIGDFNLESTSSAGINSYDNITLVQVGLRERAETAATESWKLRIKGQSGGSIQEGTTTTHNDTTWKTNGDADPKVYTLTSYVNPQDSATWEAFDLDQAQIGIEAVDADPDIWVSTMWMLVEYTEGYSPGTTFARANFLVQDNTKDNLATNNLTDKIYTRANSGSLPADDTNLSILYSTSDISDVADDDATRVESHGLDYVIHQFKNHNINNTDWITLSWNGQSNLAPSSSTVYFQVYNRNSAEWETLDSNGSADADTDFTLSGAVTSNLLHYYDSDYWVSFRVYQQHT